MKYQKPKKFDFNIIVIGAGSAGLVCSYLSATLKAKVALIEKHKMGGDCLNTGCVPSKALIKSAKMLSYAKKAKNYGFQSSKIDFDFKDVMERVQKIIQKIEPHDSIERYTKLGVDCLTGEAEILSPYKVKLRDKVYTTRSIVIATGANPRVPPFKGLEKISYLTSDNIWELRTLPQRMIILGAGPIGCELAQCFQRFGSEVTLIEKAPSILFREDAEISDCIYKQFKEEGMNILTSHEADEFHVKENGEKILKLKKEDGSMVEVVFDEVLIALGREANIKGFGLENLNIKTTSRGMIESDAFLSTNYSNIFVCGDVVGPYQFTHMAAHQAYYACINALFRPYINWLPSFVQKKYLSVNYNAVPWATYTDPEIATVGLTETMAKTQKINYELTTYPIDDLDRAITDSEDHGFIKVLTAPNSDKILGATIIHTRGSDLISEFILAMTNGLGLNAILKAIHIYPTFPEANKYLAGRWKQAHKPDKVLKWLEKFHQWRRS